MREDPRGEPHGIPLQICSALAKCCIGTRESGVQSGKERRKRKELQNEDRENVIDIRCGNVAHFDLKMNPNQSDTGRGGGGRSTRTRMHTHKYTGTIIVALTPVHL